MIHVGFYATPTMSAHIPFMNEVDQMSADGINDNPYVDRFIYKLDDLSSMYLWYREPNVNEEPRNTLD